MDSCQSKTCFLLDKMKKQESNFHKTKFVNTNKYSKIILTTFLVPKKKKVHSIINYGCLLMLMVAIGF